MMTVSDIAQLLQVDRKQAGKNVLLVFIAPPRLLQDPTVQPLQLTAQPAPQEQQPSFLGSMATALSTGACARDLV